MKIGTTATIKVFFLKLKSTSNLCSAAMIHMVWTLSNMRQKLKLNNEVKNLFKYYILFKTHNV